MNWLWILLSAVLLILGCEDKSGDGASSGEEAEKTDEEAEKKEAGGATGEGAAPKKGKLRPQCSPLGNMGPRETASASLELTIDGKKVPLELDPGATYARSEMLEQDSYAVCTGLSREERPKDWLEPGAQVIFHDGSGAPNVRLLFDGGLIKYRRPTVTAVIDGELYKVGMFQKGEVTVSPSPIACGQDMVLTYTGLEGVISRASTRESVPITLSGTLSLPVPAFTPDAPAVLETVDAVGGCDEKESRLLEVTSSDPSVLPFAGGCWGGGNRGVGGDVVSVGFRAKPSSATGRDVMMKTVPWSLSLSFSKQGLAVGQKLEVVAPGPPQGRAGKPHPQPGQVFAQIDRSGDGLGGIDFRGVSGSLEITRFEETPREGSMFTDLRIEGTMSLDFKSMGNCEAPPAPTGAPVTVTGKLVMTPE